MACVGLGLAAAFLTTDSIRIALEQRLESWLGHDVVIEGEVKFSALPMFEVSAGRIRVGPEAEPLATADRIEGRLGVLPLLLGRVELASVTVTRPKVDLAGREIAVLGNLWRRVAENGGLGAFHLNDGRVTINTASGTRAVEALAFDIEAGGVDEPIVGAGSFLYRGDPVEFRATLAGPGRLAGGEATYIEAELAAPQLQLAFRGDADLEPGFLFDGSVTASAESLRKALAWLDLPAGEAAVVDAFALSGTLEVTNGVASLSEAELDLDGNAFEGAIVLGYERARPVLQATLDARHLELAPWLEHSLDIADLTSAKLLGVDGDIRVSTETLAFGDMMLGSTAVAVVMRDGLVEVTLGEMTIFDGTLSGRVTLAPTDSGARMSAALRADHMDAERFVTRLTGTAGMTGRIEATAALSAEAVTWRELLENIAGQARLRLTGATVSPDLFADGRLEAIIPADGGTITQASARFEIAKGVATTRDLEIETPQVKATAAGSLSFLDGRLNLNGTTVTGVPPEPSESRFRLSGNWSNPVLTEAPVSVQTEIDSGVMPAVGSGRSSGRGSLMDRIIGRF